MFVPSSSTAAAHTSTTCHDLQHIADSTSRITCTRNSQCSELQCDVTQTTTCNYVKSFTLILLPCNQPVAIQLVLFNPSNVVIVNQIIPVQDYSRNDGTTTTIPVVNGVFSLEVYAYGYTYDTYYPNYMYPNYMYLWVRILLT